VKPYSITDRGLQLAVRLTPRAARDGFAGVTQDADGRGMLAVRLSVPPVDGAANKALIAFLAKRLGLRKADIAIRSGELSRLKILELTGDSRAIAARIDQLLGHADA
jgi:uncharacterized protein (TIGR00251 family)